MEVGNSSNVEKGGKLASGWWKLKESVKGLMEKTFDITKKIKNVARDDPRRVIHSLKVGIALTIVSLLYYFQPLYDNFGVSAMWAVMTVVVVFEFSVGATLGKGLNRGLATLLAGALGVGAHHLASLSGHIGEPILLGIFVFIQASISTFLRFFPKIKQRYDYGMLIFILTFSMISVSGFRDDEILEMAHKRLSTILIGGSTCVIISILVCPVWAGHDLHNLISLNLESLAIFLEGFGVEYFEKVEGGELKDDKSFMHVYKNVLNSKTSEESLANFARWEPGHRPFKFRHPWKQYLKIGALTRQCAYRIEALNGYLIADIQVPAEIKSKIQETCTEMSEESGNALKELSIAVKEMSQPSPAQTHISNAKIGAKKLKAILKSGGFWEDCDLLAVIPAITVASLLIDVVDCTDKIVEAVHQLASTANFKVSEKKSEIVPCESEKIHPMNNDCPHVVVTINGSNTNLALSN